MKSFPRWKNFNLRIKSTLLIEGLVIFVVLVTGIITTVREKNTLEQELEKRGLALAVDLARFSSRSMLVEDLPTMRRFINHTMKEDYVLYALLLNPQSQVIMHSDLSEVGKTLNDPLSKAGVSAEDPGCTHAQAEETGQWYCDIFAPVIISGVRLGTVRLGYSHQAVERAVTEAQLWILAIGLFTALVGGVAAYFLAGFISNPIMKITDATRKVADGDLEIVVPINRNDELGILSNSFNKMTQDLKKTTISKDYMDNIIESMNDTLVVIDADAKIKSVNRATCQLLGYQTDEIIGMNMSRIISPQVPIFEQSDIVKLQSGATILNREVDYLSKQGKNIPMLLSAAALKGKKDQSVEFVIIAKDIEDRKRAEKTLRESERRLHKLSSQLLTVQEEERKRLAAELHDELGQALILFKIQLRAIKNKLNSDQHTLNNECNDLITYISEVTENVRRLSRDLTPSILEDLGLWVAIRHLAEGFAKRSDIQTKFDMENVKSILSPKTQIIVYRIIQECFTNIAKHSQATMAELQIKETDGQVIFRVEDNGKGFCVEEILNNNSIVKGMGLFTMLERVRMLDGSLDIQSKEGAGTIFTCAVPIREMRKTNEKSLSRNLG